jgi:hypothetical protein
VVALVRDRHRARRVKSRVDSQSNVRNSLWLGPQLPKTREPAPTLLAACGISRSVTVAVP